MRYIDSWLSGLGLDYVIPKLKANGITTPKKLATLTLRDIYEVVGVESSEDRKKLFFLIQRLQAILHHGPGDNKGQSGTEGEGEDAGNDDNNNSPAADQRAAPQPEQSKPSASASLRESKEKPRPRSQPQRQKKAITPESAKAATDPTVESPVPIEKPLLRTRSAVANTTSADPVKRVEAVLQQKQKDDTSGSSSSAGGRGPILVPPLSPPSPVHRKTAPLISPEPLVSKVSQAEEPVRSRNNPVKEKETNNQKQTNGGNGSSNTQSTKQSSKAEALVTAASKTPPPGPVPVPMAPQRTASASTIAAATTSAPAATSSNSNARRASLSDVSQPRPHTSASLRDESPAQDSDANLHNPVLDMAIRVVVRKRPLSRSEMLRGEKDVMEIQRGGVVMVHEPKVKVDLTKVVETQSFVFDDAFDAFENNVALYSRTVKPLVSFLFQGGKGSCFAYGQTGSGKTFSMMGSDPSNPLEQSSNAGLYVLAGKDIFDTIKRKKLSNIKVNVSCFEIYGGKLFDLINNRAPVKCLEDAKQQVQLPGLTSHSVQSVPELLALMARAHSNRSTGSTGANAESSRSHQVLQIMLEEASVAAAAAAAGNGRRHHTPSSRHAQSAPPPPAPVWHGGKLSFIDLAGSERGADTTHASKQTRLEGAEINTSLLALKEVIRSLERKHGHTPFRGSKLTQVLKDSFVGEKSRTCMVACVSPSSVNCEHTLNTLRYADRVKEHSMTSRGGGAEDGAAGHSAIDDDDGMEPVEDDEESSEDEELLSPPPPPSPPKLASVTNKLASQLSPDNSGLNTSLQRQGSLKALLPSREKNQLQSHSQDTLHTASSAGTAENRRLSSDQRGHQELRRIPSSKAVVPPQPARESTELIQRTLSLLAAHKLSIAEMVEVMKDEMELVQEMEAVEERDSEGYLDHLERILDVKSLAIGTLRKELDSFQRFRA
eukprot:gene33740-40820_t